MEGLRASWQCRDTTWQCHLVEIPILSLAVSGGAVVFFSNSVDVFI